MQISAPPTMKNAVKNVLGMLALAVANACLAGPQMASIDPNAGADEPLTAQRPPAEALDMKVLESRLRETRAIPPLSKLRLKGEIDELLGRFRQLHESGMSARVGSLRQPYDRMIVKVQAMLERDPGLAEDIGNSREALWKNLSDPTKFRGQTTTASATQASPGYLTVNTLR